MRRRSSVWRKADVLPVLSRSPKVRRRFYELYGECSFATVGSYWETVQDVVELVDLRELVPAFRFE